MTAKAKTAPAALGPETINALIIDEGPAPVRVADVMLDPLAAPGLSFSHLLRLWNYCRNGGDDFMPVLWRRPDGVLVIVRFAPPGHVKA